MNKNILKEAEEIIEELIHYDAWRDNLHPNDFSYTKHRIEKALQLREDRIAELDKDLSLHKKEVAFFHMHMKDEKGKIVLIIQEQYRTLEEVIKKREDRIKELERESVNAVTRAAFLNKSLESLLSRCEAGLQSASDELGVSQPGYPAPVANANDIIKVLLSELKTSRGDKEK